MADVNADDVREFVDTDLDDETIEEIHVPVAEAWYDRGGCTLDADLKEIVVARLAAVSIQFGLADDEEVEHIRLGNAEIEEKDVGGEGLMSNKNFRAAAAMCPGLSNIDKPTASIGVPRTR